MDKSKLILAVLVNMGINNVYASPKYSSAAAITIHTPYNTPAQNALNHTIPLFFTYIYQDSLNDSEKFLKITLQLLKEKK